SDCGAVSVIDAAQSVPHMPIDVKKIGCDFLAFSGHKMLGPTGIGVLYARKELLEQLPPFLGGGDMIKEVHVDNFIPADVPAKFEAGTPPIAESIGLAEAVRYLEKIGMESIRKHETNLAKMALEILGNIERVKIYGPKERIGVVSFNVEGIPGHDTASLLDSKGIAVRSGHHCAMPLHERLGLDGTTRASFYVYNTEEDLHALAEGIKHAKRVFGA
ncbi:MAG: aminotransferase class V-fold PLP-dependent enzyme, partial [Candidatus Aenigmarchaeota archaeon]|nr:aminotransferase class V-fold PLP-dependent enzyme [Candidatus Aenigmarchaeota archaeon]